MNDSVNAIIAYADQFGITTVVLFALTDMVMGVAVAVRHSEFRWFYLGDILQKIGPMLMAYLAVSVLLQNEVLTTTVFGLILIQLSASILKNLGHLFPELMDRMPDSLVEPAIKRTGYSTAKLTEVERANREIASSTQ